MGLADLIDRLLELQNEQFGSVYTYPDDTPVDIVGTNGHIKSLGFVTPDGNGHIYLDAEE